MTKHYVEHFVRLFLSFWHCPKKKQKMLVTIRRLLRTSLSQVFMLPFSALGSYSFIFSRILIVQFVIILTASCPKTQFRPFVPYRWIVTIQRNKIQFSERLLNHNSFEISTCCCQLCPFGGVARRAGRI